MEFFNFLKEIGIAGFIDILFMSLIIYSVLIWFKKTKAAFVLTGIIIMAGVYLFAREFDLSLMASVSARFFCRDINCGGGNFSRGTATFF